MSAHRQSSKAKAARAKREREASSSSAAAPSKREARLARQVEERHQRDRRARRRKVRNGVLGVGALGVIIAGGWFVFRPDPELDGVTRPENRGGGHVESADYDSSTPTSGQHDASAPACGTYQEPLEPALAVHALEHGTVVLWYDASRPELEESLSAVAASYGSHVIVSPNSDLDSPIVATAWNRLKEYEPDDPAIGEFVTTYRERGPEAVSCDY